MDAYSYAGRSCAGYVRLWMEKHKLGSVPELVYASGDTGRNQLEARLRKDGFTRVRFQPALEQTDRKTGRVTPAAVPLQAADLFAYELFSAVRKKETPGKALAFYGRSDLSTTWFILDKIEGEPTVTSDKTLEFWKERMENFSAASTDSNLVKLASWAPKPISHV